MSYFLFCRGAFHVFGHRGRVAFRLDRAATCCGRNYPNIGLPCWPSCRRHHAAALSQEQAVASCRESVGRPIVQACMRSMGGAGANREATSLAAELVFRRK